jgi:serine/threonine-protein kinase
MDNRPHRPGAWAARGHLCRADSKTATDVRTSPDAAGGAARPQLAQHLPGDQPQRQRPWLAKVAANKLRSLRTRDRRAGKSTPRPAPPREPRLANDLAAGWRSNVACAAALAGCGQGADADKLDTQEHARLRQQALDWLRADLKAYRQMLEKSQGQAGPAIAKQMQHWLQDEDFVGVRGAEALARLPKGERQEWEKLWQEVEALRRRAAQRPAAANPARP